MSKSADQIRVGISSCLLGERVRFDGQHKKNDFLIRLLGPHIDWVPVCPEVESGMSIPREPIRLVREGHTVRVVGTKSETDYTDKLERYSQKKMKALNKYNLSAYILKRGSPSCGMERVKCYEKSGVASTQAEGVFAKFLRQANPNLPIEEEGRLNDDRIRENFIERIFAYHRLKSLFSGSWSLGELVQFHTAHKLQLMAHSPQLYKELGKLVAQSKKHPKQELQLQYAQKFMLALTKMATLGRNTNTLQHMAGYLKTHLDTDEKEELLQNIQDYRNGWVPLVVPATLISHYVRKFHISYLKGQTYLEPNPRELMLRNHV